MMIAARRALPLVLALVCLAGPDAAAAAQALPKPEMGGAPASDLYDYGVMGPPATPAIVAAARQAVTWPRAPGPVQPSWDSIAAHYRSPSWFEDAKFGIFMHWGLYSAAAHHNEWYEKHMYDADGVWHAQTFGPQERFGYKDFIPLFTAAKFDAAEWARLFQAAGARMVMPAAQHHDNFALWDSKVTRYNAASMGPRRDLIGEMATAVRKRGMKFGVSNHGVENFTFVNPAADLDARLKAAGADLYDPAWTDFYNVADRSPEAMTRFLTDWEQRNFELIDKYRPDILWFDNGVNLRVLDPLKQDVAAYYYNRSRTWGKEVSLSTKYIAYAPSNDDTRQVGSIIDFEKVGKRSPAGIRPGPWMVDDTIGSTWGYTTGMSIASPEDILGRLIDTTSKGGFYLLNISPMADGTIPQAQRDTLLGIGAWLKTNGEAIYGTRPWKTFGEGNLSEGVRFTTKGPVLYAVALGRPAGTVRIASLGLPAGKVSRVTMLGGRPVAFHQDQAGLTLSWNGDAGFAPAFRIAGLRR